MSIYEYAAMLGQKEPFGKGLILELATQVLTTNTNGESP